jgi:PAS domain S-box-containing protein
MNKPSILVVEDEIVVAADLVNKIERLGYGVVGSADSGEEAIAIAREQRPSLVLMDIRLAGRLDGIATAEIIRLECDLPVVFLTAHSDSATIGRAVQADAFGYLIKPFEAHELRTTIEIALYKHSAERRLRESEARFRALFEGAGDGIIIADRTGRCIDVNVRGCALTGYEREEILDKGIQDLVAEQDRPQVAVGIAQLLSGNALVSEWLFQRKDGSRLPGEVNTQLLPDGRIISVLRDLSERKRAEMRLALLADTASELLRTDDPQQAVDALCRKIMGFLDCQLFLNFLTDQTSGRLSLNASAGISDAQAREIQQIDYSCCVCGCAAHERSRVVVENVAASVDPQLERLKSYGVHAYACYPLVVQNQVLGTLSFGSRTRPDFRADELSLMHAVADLVAIAIQHQRTQLQLRQINAELEARVTERTAVAERRASMLQSLASEMNRAEQRERERLARILHDHLQQLLVAAQFQTDLLSMDLPSRRHQHMVGKLRAQLTEALQSSRTLTVELCPPVLREMGLGPALEWLSRWMEERHSLSVRIIAEEIGSIPDLHRTFLFTAVRELLFNVVKHSKVRKARVHLKTAAPGWVLVSVADSGSGFIPSEVSQQPSDQGGFGLFSIRERTEMIGGTFAIESSPGHGTVVTLKVPRGTPEATPPPSVPAEKPPVKAAVTKPARKSIVPIKLGRKIRLLLADDHRIVREGLAKILSFEPDIEVVGEAGDGELTLQLAHKLQPDIVVMDVNMPIMSGLETARRLQDEMPAVRVIGLSMHDQDESAEAMKAAGAIAYLSKGGPSKVLVAIIRKAALSGKAKK